MAYVLSDPFHGPFRSLQGLGAVNQAQANAFVGKYVKLILNNGSTSGPGTLVGVSTSSVVIQDSAGFKETYNLKDVNSIVEVQQVVVEQPVYVDYGYPAYYGGWGGRRHGGHHRRHHGHHGLASYYGTNILEQAIDPVAIMKDPETWKIVIPVAILLGLLYFLKKK